MTVSGACPLRLANLLQLQHNLSVDLYIEKTLATAKLIVLRLLGGASYWSYGLDQIEALARERGIALAVLPGDAQPDPELTRALDAGGAALRAAAPVSGGGRRGQCAQLPCLLPRISLQGTRSPGSRRALLPKAGLYRDTSTADQPLGGASPSTVPSSKARRQRPSTRWSMRLPAARHRLQGHLCRKPEGCSQRRPSLRRP